MPYVLNREEVKEGDVEEGSISCSEVNCQGQGRGDCYVAITRLVEDNQHLQRLLDEAYKEIASLKRSIRTAKCS